MKPLAEAELPAGASAWAPTLGDCLPGPGRYGWTVGARGASGGIQWSTPGLFRVVVPERPAAPEQRSPATTTLLDGVAALIVQSSPSAMVSYPASAPPRFLAADAFAPPACTGTVFSDVTIAHPLCAWIEKFSADQIGTECAAGRYCPDNPVTRGQIAQLFERAMRGTDAWRPEAGDGALPNLPPGLPGLTPLDTTDTVGQDSSVTIGADGLGLISYFDNTNDDLKVAHCSNVTCTTATITPLDTTGSVGQYTSITIGADGLGLISYHDSTNGDLKVAHCADAHCTTAAITPLDTTGTVGWHTSITIGADGLGLISYFAPSNLDFKVAHCSNVNCTAATITPLDTAGTVGSFTSIAIGIDGLGLVSYFDDSNDDLKVAHCSNVNCTAATITSLDTTGVVGQYTSITIGADGLGLISYYDETNFNLKVAHCSNLLCDAATLTPLDTPAAVGFFTSVTIGTDGLGLISYFDGNPNFDLKVAHCSDVNCTTATITLLDTTGIVGQYTSITIGADGLGLISYYDASTGDLKVGHCTNVLCAPYFRRR